MLIFQRSVLVPGCFAAACLHATAQATLEQSATTGSKVILIAKDIPDKRYLCKVLSHDAEQITCRNHFHKRASIFLRDDVSKVIEPANRSGTHDRQKLLLIGAALVIPSFFVPVTAVAVVMQVVGSVLAFEAFNPGDDGDRAEEILYQAPAHAP